MAEKLTLPCCCGEKGCTKRIELEYDDTTKCIMLKGFNNSDLWFTNYVDLDYESSLILTKYIQQFFKVDKQKKGKKAIPVEEVIIET